MDKFLGTYNLSRQNHEKIENFNRTIMSNDIESVIKNLPKKKSPEPGDFTNESHQTFREELIPILLKLYLKIKRREDFHTHLMKSALPS